MRRRIVCVLVALLIPRHTHERLSRALTGISHNALLIKAPVGPADDVGERRRRVDVAIVDVVPRIDRTTAKRTQHSKRSHQCTARSHLRCSDGCTAQELSTTRTLVAKGIEVFGLRTDDRNVGAVATFVRCKSATERPSESKETSINSSQNSPHADLRRQWTIEEELWQLTNRR